MSERTPYEQLIAARLDQVPVPDMADSIWADFDRQLDVSPDAPDASAPASFKRIGWYGLVLVAVVLLWWYFGHQATVPVAPRVLPETHAPMPVTPPVQPPPVKDSPKPAKKKLLPTLPVEPPKDTVWHNTIPADSVRMDSMTRPRLTLPDVNLYTVPPPLPASPGKRRRGVRGISEDDYRITASKDSGRKKH